MCVLPGDVQVLFQITMIIFSELRMADNPGLILVKLIPEGIDAFAIADPQNLVAADLTGNMFHSSDSGLSWSQVFTSPGMQPSFSK